MHMPLLCVHVLHANLHMPFVGRTCVPYELAYFNRLFSDNSKLTLISKTKINLFAC